MSMIKRMLASIGIGNATVETTLEKSAYYPGEIVNGTIYINGGKVEQKIEQIYMHLMTEYVRKRGYDKVRERGVIGSFPIVEPQIIQPNEKQEIPFSFQMPYETPMTIHRTSVWIRTGLEIKSTIDPKDHDTIEILEHPNILKIRESLATIGFYQTSVEQVFLPKNRFTIFPVGQQFSYKTSGSLTSLVTEIKIMYFVCEKGIHLIFELDTQNDRLFDTTSEVLHLHEKIIQLTFTNEELKQGIEVVGDKIAKTIRTYFS